jgi:hypothetical protein
MIIIPPTTATSPTRCIDFEGGMMIIPTCVMITKVQNLRDDHEKGDDTEAAGAR